MKLTGKCKDDFEKWYLKGVSKEDNFDQYAMQSFYSNGNSMQYGVFVDYFDSVGIEIILEYFFYNSFNVRIEEDNVEEDYHQEYFIKTECERQEARTKAIEKANEIYNG